MTLAGFQKLSLVDYPGHLSSIVFTQGCNFRCGYCHNPELIATENRFHCDEEDILSHLEKRKDFIEGVVITGGEPTIHEDLPVFIEKIRKSGKRVKLDTNGSNPDLLEQLVAARAVDYVALDVKTSFAKYFLIAQSDDMPEKVIRSINIVMNSGLPYEMRTTCVPGIVNESDLLEIGKAIKGAEKWCLQQFHSLVTLEAGFGKIVPYDRATLENFKTKISDYALSIEIRGV